MSTVNAPLKYLWSAQFEDGTTMNQPEDDKSVNHDDNADHNGTAFTDLLAHDSPVKVFCMGNYALAMDTGEFFVFAANDQLITKFTLEQENEILTERKLIYHRVVRKETIMHPDGTQEDKDPYIHAFVMGYEGKNKRGKVVKKTILVE